VLIIIYFSRTTLSFEMKNTQRVDFKIWQQQFRISSKFATLCHQKMLFFIKLIFMDDKTGCYHVNNGTKHKSDLKITM
jgi:hypothetical protein